MLEGNARRAAGVVDAAGGINTYRVLLTRARYETVIWVPEGDADDVTRSPSEFDAIARFLLECGASRLEEMAAPVASVSTAPTLLL